LFFHLVSYLKHKISLTFISLSMKSIMYYSILLENKYANTANIDITVSYGLYYLLCYNSHSRKTFIMNRAFVWAICFNCSKIYSRIDILFWTYKEQLIVFISQTFQMIWVRVPVFQKKIIMLLSQKKACYFFFESVLS
jgi:hypothetical protein